MRWRAVATLSMKFKADAGSSLPCRFQEVVFIVGLSGRARARVVDESLGLYVLAFARCLDSSTSPLVVLPCVGCCSGRRRPYASTSLLETLAGRLSSSGDLGLASEIRSCISARLACFMQTRSDRVSYITAKWHQRSGQSALSLNTDIKHNSRLSTSKGFIMMY